MSMSPPRRSRIACPRYAKRIRVRLLGIPYSAPFLTIRGRLRLGEEMQHDTSPHEVELAGKKRKVQTASAVLCYSRMLFFQCSPTFQRFDCKVFLTEALRYMGGATA